MSAIRLIIVMLFSTCLLIAVSISCVQGSNTNSNQDIYWFTDPPDVFHTNDLHKAQQEVPFIISLPNYLPNNIGPYPYLIEGPVGASAEDIITVRIMYQEKGDSDHAIFINEQNTSFNKYLIDSDGNWFTVAEIKILEIKFDSKKLSSSETLVVSGFRYLWNQNDVDIDVDIFGYDQGEARKIIESMVR